MCDAVQGYSLWLFFCANTILWPILSLLIIFVAKNMHLDSKFLSFNCMCGISFCNFFSNRVVKPWNRLTTELKESRTVKSFKEGLDNII